jgi:hypothetical protein
MQNKFEQLLDYLINEETQKANELFHQIVVEKSRGIYESLISEEEKKEEDDKEANKEDDVEKTDENFGFDSGEQVIEIGGEPADDLMTDVGMGDDDEGEEDEMAMDAEFGDDSEMGGEGDVEDRVQDLEDELESLKAEFEALIAGEGSDMESEEGEEEGEEGEDEGEDEEDVLREYTEQVGGKQYNQYGKMGDNGQNTKSIVAGKNDMGGTASNIAQGGEAKGEGTKGGLLNPSAKEESAGNINVPGGNAGKTAFKKKEPGHGAEKKGAGEQAGNTKSPLGSK